MEIIMFFPLLVLVCSASGDQTEITKETLDQQTALQQAHSQDIQAELRELTASLAALKEQIKVLQRENQDQVAKLESQTTEINQLKLQLQVKQVAFSASLLDQGDGYTGPFNTQITLIFRRVVTNIGNAYNPNTGIFTAPVKGVYHFEWKTYGYGGVQNGAVLFRNEEHIFISYELQSSGAASSSNFVSLLLEVGDQVFLRLWANSKIYDNQVHHNTFSGHLLFTM